MGSYCIKMNISDKLCESLATRDRAQRGQLVPSEILEAFKAHKMSLNSIQMSKIQAPLPVDALDNSVNYVIMIELLFGRPKADETRLKYKLADGINKNMNRSAGGPA